MMEVMIYSHNDEEQLERLRWRINEHLEIVEVRHRFDYNSNKVLKGFRQAEAYLQGSEPSTMHTI